MKIVKKASGEMNKQAEIRNEIIPERGKSFLLSGKVKNSVANVSTFLSLVFCISCTTDPNVVSDEPYRESVKNPVDVVDVMAIPDAVPRNEKRTRAGNPVVYKVLGKQYKVLTNSKGYRQRGIASWYGKKFHGRKTSNGEIYDMYAMTAAHKTLPIPSYVRVTNLKNQRSVVVRVNDREKQGLVL
jgi:rare lipoprotein A